MKSLNERTEFAVFNIAFGIISVIELLIILKIIN